MAVAATFSLNIFNNKQKTPYILTNNSTIRKLNIINTRPISIDQSILPAIWNLADKKKEIKNAKSSIQCL
jgi:hypothetical protein